MIDERAGGHARREHHSVASQLPEQVGAAAVYLASDDAMTITGVTLKIDGGITVAGP